MLLTAPLTSFWTDLGRSAIRELSSELSRAEEPNWEVFSCMDVSEVL